MGNTTGLIKQLYWRDFYAQAIWYFPEVIQSNASRPEFRALTWKTGKEADELFKKWCDGETGVPIVDAGMREMN